MPQAGSHADRVVWGGAHDVYDALYERTGGEVLAGALGRLGGRSRQDALVDVALDVGLHGGPVLLVYEVDDEAPEEGRVLNLEPRSLEDLT